LNKTAYPDCVDQLVVLENTALGDKPLTLYSGSALALFEDRLFKVVYIGTGGKKYMKAVRMGRNFDSNGHARRPR